jgi:hypothetical protein
VSGVFTASTPSYAQLTGTPTYATTGTFLEPDHNTANSGADYYMYDGAANGNTNSPEYGHVACAYDAVTDPWVDNQDAAGAGTGLDHRRNPTYTP